MLINDCFQVIVDCFSLFDEEKSILEVNELRIHYFWDNNFLNKQDKRKFDRNVKIHVYLQYISYAMTIPILTCVVIAPYFPPSLCNENWPFLARFIVQIFGYICVTIGYFLAIIHESFYAYTILHGYFQMQTLKAYLRYEFLRYEKIDLTGKIYSYKYQTLIEVSLLRCIKQHKILVT